MRQNIFPISPQTPLYLKIKKLFLIIFNFNTGDIMKNNKIKENQNISNENNILNTFIIVQQEFNKLIFNNNLDSKKWSIVGVKLNKVHNKELDSYFYYYYYLNICFLSS
jgi:hypothetical protein